MEVSMSIALPKITEFFPIMGTPAGTELRQSEVPLAWSIDLEIRVLYMEALRLSESTAVLSSQVRDWCQRAHECLVSAARSAPTLLAAWQAALLPMFMKSDFLKRCRTKPRGYAGDYRSIQMMYDLTPSGDDLVGKAVDAWALNQPCPRAVRNRRFLIEGLVQNLRSTFPSGTLSIVSLGSGPAAELFDCQMPDTHFTLVDIDDEAINYVRQKADLNGISKRIDTVRGNIIKIILGRENGIQPDQHSFYSLGLIDYFDDELVVRLLDYIHANLRTGGIAYLGNFTPDHPNADFFQHALDWPLVLRSKDHLQDLINRSLFRNCPTCVGSEAEGIQLFIKATKI
jgi:hypothetical protein